MNKHQDALILAMMQHDHLATASDISEGAIYQVTKYNGGHLGLCSAGMRRAGCLDLQRVMYCFQANNVRGQEGASARQRPYEEQEGGLCSSQIMR